MTDTNTEDQTLNLLELVPLRSIEWEKSDTGLVVLLKPRLRHGWLAKHILPRIKKSSYTVQLDAVGSFLWETCNGIRRVKEMADMLKAEFGDSVEPLYERLSLFLHSLEKHGFISYKD